MAQQVGRKMPQVGIPQQDYSPVSAEPTDAVGNAGAHSMIFGNPLGSKTVTVGDIAYIGECGRPGAATADPVWRMSRLEKLADGTELKHAYVPAAGAVPAKYGGFDHVFDDYATLDYAY
jgi:hypothetical protein